MSLINCETNLILTWPATVLWSDLKEKKLTRINTNKSKNTKRKPIFRLLNGSKFLRSKQTFCFNI